MKRTIKEKLAKEKPEEKVIRLYKEGLFFVAYNYSAIRFKSFISPSIKILKQELKNGEWYLKIGASETSSMLEKLPVRNDDGTFKDYVEIPSKGLENHDLENAIPDQIITREKKRIENKVTSNNGEKEVIIQLKSLNLAEVTPMQALTLINKWQQQLKTEEYTDVQS